MAEVVSAHKGDRVRATCGESVIVGTVTQANPGGVGVDVKVLESIGSYWYWLPTGAWTVEVIAPPIPDDYGTVVLDKDNGAWQRGVDGWYIAARDNGFWSFDKLQTIAGPVTVLWTPEAKS